MKNKILVFGANGFIGRHLFNYIRKNNFNENFEIIGYDLNESIDKQILFADLNNKSTLCSILMNEKADYIINLIGLYKSNDFEQLYTLNAGLSRNICEIVIEKKLAPQKILFIGSAAEYGNNPKLPYSEDSILMPVNYYGLSKAIQTQIFKYYLNNYNLNMNIARIFNIIGPDVPETLSIGSFLKQIKSIKTKGYIEVGNINALRDFLHINDVVDAIWKILFHGNCGVIYNVCSGSTYSIKDLLKLFINQSGKNIEVIKREKIFKLADIDTSYGCKKLLEDTTNWHIQHPVFEQIYL